METSPEKQIPRSPPDKQAEESSQYKGIRLRKWGRWVSEVRMPKSRAKIWLGSYDTAEQAARAYDAAVFCLRGANNKFNFCVPHIPRPSSFSREEIQLAATKYALEKTPSANNLNEVLREEAGSPPMSLSVSEMEASNEGHAVSREQSESATVENLFADSDGNPYSSLERLPSFDASTMEFTLTPAEEQGYVIFDSCDLWNL